MDITTERAETTEKGSHTTRRGALIIINRTALGQVNGNYNAAVEQSGNNCYIRPWNDSVAAATPREEGRWQKSR
jgi:hypothetical protein